VKPILLGVSLDVVVTTMYAFANDTPVCKPYGDIHDDDGGHGFDCVVGVVNVAVPAG
jgi:hypothetical protein